MNRVVLSGESAATAGSFRSHQETASAARQKKGSYAGEGGE